MLDICKHHTVTFQYLGKPIGSIALEIAAFFVATINIARELQQQVLE